MWKITRADDRHVRPHCGRNPHTIDWGRANRVFGVQQRTEAWGTGRGAFCVGSEQVREGQRQEAWADVGTMRHAVVLALVLALLPWVAEGWAPKKHAPIDLRKMRPSSTRGREGSAPVAPVVAVEHLSRRQLQVGNYDLTNEEANTRAGAHWDDSKLGITGYDFDQPTHQGAEIERYGYRPVVHEIIRDPNAPPTTAEMYPLLLNMDAEEQIAELAAEYVRNLSSKNGAYASDWCRRSAILPGESNCSPERDVQGEGDETNREAEAARIQAMLDALESVLSASNDGAP